jgi:dTDP-4-dehydrorhamnose reductase
VFDGKSAPYKEGDPTNPINRYGCIKVECEHIVEQGCQGATIVRPILMYGWHAPEGRANPATWIIDRLSRGEKIHLVTDVYENPLWSYHCAEAIWRLIRLGKTGIWHIAGKDVVNRYEFGKLVVQTFGLDLSLLHPVNSSFFPTIAPRPRNTSFLVERMRTELGMEPLSVLEGLEHMRALAKFSCTPC